MERYSGIHLYHLQDDIRVRELYDGIIASAKIGHKRKDIWWMKNDNIPYIISQLKWYFYQTKIDEYADHMTISWELD